MQKSGHQVQVLQSSAYLLTINIFPNFTFLWKTVINYAPPMHKHTLLAKNPPPLYTSFKKFGNSLIEKKLLRIQNQ